MTSISRQFAAFGSLGAFAAICGTAAWAEAPSSSAAGARSATPVRSSPAAKEAGERSPTRSRMPYGSGYEVRQARGEIERVADEPTKATAAGREAGAAASVGTQGSGSSTGAGSGAGAAAAGGAGGDAGSGGGGAGAGGGGGGGGR
jgi:hypothetical protein